MDTVPNIDKRTKEYRNGLVNAIPINPFEGKIDRAIMLLERVVDKLDRQFEGRISSQPVIESAPAKETPPVMPVHIPFEYRVIVDEMLNKQFGIEIIPHTDSPQFDFVIIVPDKYSSFSEEQKRMYKEQRHLKVLSYSDGTVGVRAYVEKVWSHFNLTIQALIVSDRQS